MKGVKKSAKTTITEGGKGGVQEFSFQHCHGEGVGSCWKRCMGMSFV